jgi:hypothetical protein
LLTLGFEFVFGHYVMGQPWNRLVEVFQIPHGNLWLLVVMVTGTSPWLAARVRRLTQ